MTATKAKRAPAAKAPVAKAAAAPAPVAPTPVAATPAPVAPAPVAKVAIAEAPVAEAVVTEAPVAKAALAATAQIEQVVAETKDAIETVVKASQDAATKNYEKAANMATDQVQAAVNAQSEAFKSYEDAIQAAKATVDAFTKSGTILTQGLQDLSKAVISLTQQTVEETVSASQQLLTVKSLPELVEAQAALAKASFDKLVAEGTRLSDMSVKLIEQATAPITQQVNATVNKLVKHAA